MNCTCRELPNSCERAVVTTRRRGECVHRSAASMHTPLQPFSASRAALLENTNGSLAARSTKKPARCPSSAASTATSCPSCEKDCLRNLLIPSLSAARARFSLVFFTLAVLASSPANRHGGFATLLRVHPNACIPSLVLRTNKKERMSYEILILFITIR